MRIDKARIDQILAALNVDDVSCVADINGQAPDLAIALHRRYGCRIDVPMISADGSFAGAGAQDIQPYFDKLTASGVDANALRPVRATSKLDTYDIVLSIAGLGAVQPARMLKPFLDTALHPMGRVVIEIRKGSGNYPFLNKYGSCDTLVPVGDAQTGLVVMSAEPGEEAPTLWPAIAQELAGKDGFFRDVTDHSFLFVKRNDTLVVTFDNLDIVMNRREDRRPWGYEFIEAQGWSMLGVMANGWTWFREPDVVRTFEELRDTGFFKQFQRVVFYGASMGGYAAAAYSAAAPGSIVFTISPQSTLDPSIVPWETRYRRASTRDFSGEFGDASIASQTAEAVHILFDPYVQPDAAHAARYTGDNVTLWRCPLLGHRLGSSLAQMGLLSRIARSVIDGEMSEQDFHRMLRARHSFPRYQRELANLAFERGHSGLARRVCDHVLRARDDRFFRQMLSRLHAA